MTHLGSISGRGHIFVRGKEIGGAQYEIDIYRLRLGNEALGRLTAEISVIWQAFNADDAALKLETGEMVKIALDGQADDSATFAIVGPLRGLR